MSAGDTQPQGDARDQGSTLDDGFGNEWLTCGADCGLEVVRPGQVQCTRVPCLEDREPSAEEDACAHSSPRCAPWCGVEQTELAQEDAALLAAARQIEEAETAQ